MASQQRLEEARKRLQELRSQQGGDLESARTRLQELRTGAPQLPQLSPTTPTITGEPEREEATPSLARKVQNIVGNIAGPSEFGRGIAGALSRFTPEAQQLEESRKLGQSLQDQVLQQIREKRSRGEDVSRLLRVLGKSQETQEELGKQIEEFTTGGVTPRQVLASAAQTALTIGTAGTFGGIAAAGKLGVTGGRLLGVGGALKSRIATGAALGGAFGTAGAARGEGDISLRDVGVGAALGAALPVGGAFLRGVGRTFKATPRVIIGDADILAVGQARKFPEEVGRFVSGIKGESGGVTLGSIATETKKAAQKAREKSFAIFKGSEAKLPTKQLNKNKVKNDLNQTIRDTLGLPSKGRLNFKGTGLEPGEIRVINSLQTRIGQWKDFSPAGLNRLKQSIDNKRFIRRTEVFAGSDDVVIATKRKMNSIVDEAFEKFSPARARASKDIRFFEELGFNVTGTNKRNVDVTADKLRSIASLITDRNRKEETKLLLRGFRERTGFDLEQQLTSFAAAERINRPFKGALIGGLSGITRSFDTIAVRGLANTARQTGKIKTGELSSILNRVIGVEQSAKFMFEFNQLPLILQREVVFNMLASMTKKTTNTNISQ